MDKQSEPLQPEKKASSPTAEKKALVIGVSEYDHEDIQKLDFCKNDGQKVQETLQSVSYRISDDYKLLGRVEFDKMRDTIYDFFDNSNTKADDTLLFYYSGHGVPDTDGDVYLATSEIDPDSPYRRGFSFNELTKMMNNSSSTKVVAILDCCYSGAAKIAKGIGKGGDDAAAKLGRAAIDDKSTNLNKNKGICLLAASQAAQEAYSLKEGNYSIFTHYLLEGLKGDEKAVDAYGNVTAETLGKYVHRAIVNLPADKRPKQTPIRKIEVGDEIVVAEYPQLAKGKKEQEKELTEKDCFYITPLSEGNSESRKHSDRVFHEIIEPAAKDCNYRVAYNPNSELGLTVSQLIEHLYTDGIIVADLTGNNPHVLYELGVCHAFRKHVIQIKDMKRDDVEIDLPGIQTIDFDLEDKDKLEKSKREIIRQIKSIELKTLPLPLTLPPDIEMVCGEKEVLDFLTQHKKETKDEYCCMWITDEYDRESLDKYYSEEAKIGIDNIIRLVNTKTLDKERIREHIEMFKTDISAGKYKIFSTNHSDYEIALCYKNRRKNDVIAILMFPDNLNNKVDLAIYSYAPAFVDAVKTRFRDFQQQGKRFRLIKDDIDSSIESWIQQSQNI
jgi:hypothetical protein